ncbi:putative conjugal transfer protein TraU [Orientia tsutsugamushi str. Gilliam]|uniref:Putative conjugal transfer protein TraU n=1 Tax=Orientia tsutsugamushi str. Gilliam TaxID=1359184 RepID=A0A0F3MCF2_ORITS|nr:putative conjugal transfer protein TraU [Orientia tsutsugamushi str. Gilliam]
MQVSYAYHEEKSVSTTNTYSIPETKSCKSIGQTEAIWQAGREFPVNGEDFVT